MHFLITLKEEKSNNNFNPESCGIPFNELAQIHATMDIDERERRRRFQQAFQVYLDLKVFFSSESNQNYLTTIIHPRELLLILDELENCFLNVEEFEKCQIVKTWKEKVSSKMSPDQLFDHLY